MACHIPLESSRWGLQLCFKSHLNPRSSHKVMGPQSCGNPGTKCHLDVAPVERHIVYYKGEGGAVLGQNAIWMWPPWKDTEYILRGKVVASPKSGPWWILWVRVCPWFVLPPKVLQLCTNHLVLVLCRSMWVIEAC